MSEELEHSLQQAIETYLNDRLRSIDEQLAQLQNEMSEAMARLREQSATQSLDGTAVSAAIFAHLQTARSERLSAAPTPTPVEPHAADLKRAVRDLEAQQSQADVLKSLLRSAVQFADRVALFVVKNEQAIGWRLAKLDDPDLEMIGGVSLPLTAQTIVTRAARGRTMASGADAADSDYALLLDQLGGAPAAVTAIPLIVRGKVVAVLYADSPSTDANAMNLDALELLTRVASMAVNLVSIQRPAVAQPAVSEATPAVTEQPETAASFETAQDATYTPQIETESTDSAEVAAPVEAAAESAPDSEPQSIEAEPAPEAETIDSEIQSPAPEPMWAEPPTPVAGSDVVSSQVWSMPVETPAEPEPTPAPVFEPEPVTEPTSPMFSPEHSTPLGSSRRYGISEPELPIEVSEDERRLHNDARRFARLLVSEIKLYNEPKVQEGRSKGDLYERLRDDIDRSRQMYDKRVAPPVAARHDYFHQELVNTLAEGDVAKLGMSYPGAAVSA